METFCFRTIIIDDDISPNCGIRRKVLVVECCTCPPDRVVSYLSLQGGLLLDVYASREGERRKSYPEFADHWPHGRSKFNDGRRQERQQRHDLGCERKTTREFPPCYFIWIGTVCFSWLWKLQRQLFNFSEMFFSPTNVSLSVSK